MLFLLKVLNVSLTKIYRLQRYVCIPPVGHNVIYKVTRVPPVVHDELNENVRIFLHFLLTH